MWDHKLIDLIIYSHELRWVNLVSVNSSYILVKLLRWVECELRATREFNEQQKITLTITATATSLIQLLSCQAHWLGVGIVCGENININLVIK